MRLKALDWLSIVIALALITSLSVVGWASSPPATTVHIKGEDGHWVFPLEQDRAFEVVGPVGMTRVVIHDGAAWVEDSSCRDKLCVHMGHVLRTGQWIACLPNRVFIHVDGPEASSAATDAGSW